MDRRIHIEIKADAERPGQAQILVGGQDVSHAVSGYTVEHDANDLPIVVLKMSGRDVHLNLYTSRENLKIENGSNNEMESEAGSSPLLGRGVAEDPK
jgi:hypothetical protein